MAGFWQRLKQRTLVQWIAAYVAACFALIQVLDVVAQRFGLPDLIEKLIILALAVGFFVALVLAWYHGERGAQRVGGTELLIIALLLAIGGGVLWGYARVPAKVPAAGSLVKLVPPASATKSPSLPAAVTAKIPEQSVAVLPFVNESGDMSQRYFSDGLSDDLITTLSQFAGLKVISRDSSFQFRDSKDSSAEMGEKLGVAHLLEGSVQRAGGEVRITATLVNAADGTVVWSQRYDKPYKDLFTLQDAITKAVAGVLKAKLLSAPGAVVQSDRPPGGSLAAYNAYLQGKFHARQFTEAGQRKAIDFYRQAVRLDPHYALAYARMAYTWANLAGNFLQTPDQYRAAYAKASRAVAMALRLEPNLAAAHYAKAFVLTVVDFDWTGAESEYQRAAQLAPNDAAYKAALGYAKATLGLPRQAVALLRQALVLDPLCVSCYGSLALTLPALSDMDAAAQAGRHALELSPASYFDRMQLVYTEALRGDSASALREARLAPPGPWQNISMAIALQIGSDRTAADAALKQLIDTQAGQAAYQIAEIYALRRDPDNMFKWLERARLNHDPGLTQLLTDPPILRYKNDSRFAAFCKQVGLPTTTDAVAMQ